MIVFVVVKNVCVVLYSVLLLVAELLQVNQETDALEIIVVVVVFVVVVFVVATTLTVCARAEYSILELMIILCYFTKRREYNPIEIYICLFM